MWGKRRVDKVVEKKEKSKVENTFGVDASAATSGNTMMVATSNKIEDVEEKTEFNVILEKVPTDKKIPILKVVRSLTGLGLKEAKEIVESVPKQVQESLTKDSAEDA